MTITQLVPMTPIVRAFDSFTYEGIQFAYGNPAHVFVQRVDATVPQDVAQEALFLEFFVYNDWSLLDTANGAFIQVDSHPTYGCDDVATQNLLSYHPGGSNRTIDTDLGFGMPIHTPFEETIIVGLPPESAFGSCPSGGADSHNLCTEFTTLDYRAINDTFVWRTNPLQAPPYDTTEVFNTGEGGIQPTYKALMAFYFAGDSGFDTPYCTCASWNVDYSAYPDPVIAPFENYFAMVPNDLQQIWFRVASVCSGIAWRNCVLTIQPWKRVTYDAEIGRGAGGVRRRRRVVGAGAEPISNIQ